MKIIPILLLALTFSAFSAENTVVSVTTNRQYESDVVRVEFQKNLNPPPIIGVEQQPPQTITIGFSGVDSTVPEINLDTMRNVTGVKITPAGIVITIDQYVDHRVVVRDNVVMVGVSVPSPVQKVEVKRAPDGLAVIQTLSSDSIMKVANALFANGVYDDVIMNLNELLMLPEDANTQKGQELLCQTYEKMGKLDRAKAEYAAYIAKYPDSPSTKTMRQRLITLEIATPGVALRGVKIKPKEGTENTFSASISDYYYVGASGPTLGGWKTDQKVNIINFRLTETYRDEQYTTKIMFRHSRLYDLLRDHRDTRLTSIASVEFTDAIAGYSIKGGRQMPTPGVIGRFDGLSGKYSIADGIKIVGAVGTPYVGITGTKRVFYGVGAEYMTDSNVILTGYTNIQYADGIAERKALGVDVRYANNGTSLYGSVEYDTVYKKVNAITMQTTIALGDGFDLYGIYDRRKFPVLMGDKALVLGFNRPDGRAYKSFGEAVAGSNLSMSDIFQFIDKTSPYGNVMVLGVNKTLTDKWSMYFDTQVSNITSTTDPTYIPTLENPTSKFTVPGTGDTISNNLNFFGNNVISKNDMHNIMLGRTSDKKSSGYSVALLNGKTFEDYRVDISNRFMSRTSNNTTTNIFSAAIRGNMKIGKDSSIEAQIAVTRTKAGESSPHYSKSFYLGVRHDF